MKEGLQWIVDYNCPTEDYMIHSNEITALLNLKTLILTKSGELTIDFLNPDEQFHFLFTLYEHNPSIQTGEMIQNCIAKMTKFENYIPNFIDQLFKNYKQKPTYEKYVNIMEILVRFHPIQIPQFIKLIIDLLPKTEDYYLILSSAFQELAKLPINFIQSVEGVFISKIFKLKTGDFDDKQVFIEEYITKLVNLYEINSEFNLAFNLIGSIVEKRPKYLTFALYQKLTDLKSKIDPIPSESYNNLENLILQTGREDIQFRIYESSGRFNEACSVIASLTKKKAKNCRVNFAYGDIDGIDRNDKNLEEYGQEEHSDEEDSNEERSEFEYDENDENSETDGIWMYITQILPHLQEITEVNKKLLTEVLKQLITNWLNLDSKQRPDTSISEAALQLKHVYESLKLTDGTGLWNAWFRKFCIKYRTLRKLRAAFSQVGLDFLKKN